MQQTFLEGGHKVSALCCPGVWVWLAELTGSAGNLSFLPRSTQPSLLQLHAMWLQVKQLRSQLEGQRQAHEHELALLAAQLRQETEVASAKLQRDAVAAEGTAFEGQLVALQQAQAAAQERLREWRTALLQQRQEVEAESAAAHASMQVCCLSAGNASMLQRQGVLHSKAEQVGSGCNLAPIYQMCSTLTPDPRRVLNPLPALQKHQADLLQQQRDMQQHSQEAAAALQQQKEAMLEQQHSLQVWKAGAERSAVRAEHSPDQQKAVRSLENQPAPADFVNQLQQDQHPVAAALQLSDSAAAAAQGSLELRAASQAASNRAAASEPSSPIAPQQEVAAVQHGRVPASASSPGLSRSASPADGSRKQGGTSTSSPAGGTGAGVQRAGSGGLSSDGNRPAYGRRSSLQSGGSQLERQPSGASGHWQSEADRGLPADSLPGRGHQPEQQSEVGHLERRPPAPAAVRALPTVSQMQGAKAATVGPVPGRREQQTNAASPPASPALALEPAATREGPTTPPSASQTGLSTHSGSVYTPPAAPSRQHGTALAAQQAGDPDARADSASSDEFSYFTNSLAVGSADGNKTQLPKAGAAPVARLGAAGAALQQRAAAGGVVLHPQKSGGSLAASGKLPEPAAGPKAGGAAEGLLQLSRALPKQQQEQEELNGDRRSALLEAPSSTSGQLLCTADTPPDGSTHRC